MPSSSRKTGCIGYFRYTASDEERTFFQHTLIKLIVSFEGGAHIDIKVIYGSASAFLDKMSEFEPLHTANHRTVIVEIPVTAAYTMDDADRLGYCRPIPQDDIAVRRSCRVAQSLEFKAGEDIRQTPVSILGDPARIEEVISCGKNDIAYFDRN